MKKLYNQPHTTFQPFDLAIAICVIGSVEGNSGMRFGGSADPIAQPEIKPI
ncbi:MAG: hypothetical protein IJ609_05340 [Paludibacteraceae bacterium]|nr:hypothetical protein [Paludibacteraceae bacterium]